jgi:hypothetical protein
MSNIPMMPIKKPITSPFTDLIRDNMSGECAWLKVLVIETGAMTAIDNGSHSQCFGMLLK